MEGGGVGAGLRRSGLRGTCRQQGCTASQEWDCGMPGYRDVASSLGAKGGPWKLWSFPGLGISRTGIPFCSQIQQLILDSGM